VKFRRQALQQLEAPEQLDRVVRLTTVPSWLTTVALILAVVAAGVWAVRTVVPRTVQAAGVLIHSNGLSALDAADSGQVTKVWAAAHQRVTKGTPLYSLRTGHGSVDVVTAPSDAYLVSWLVAEGGFVTPGAHVADLERLDTPGDKLQAVVYAPAAAAPMLQPGITVEVAAAAAPRNVFGTLSGRVVDVGAFPETESSMRAFLGAGQDLRRLLAGGSVVRVTVVLDVDLASADGLRWSKAPPPFQLNSISEVTAWFTVAREHPIDWLLRR
jgi:multidrug efflux pump subunit AcrA (membrane-fusion protein)